MFYCLSVAVDIYVNFRMQIPLAQIYNLNRVSYHVIPCFYKSKYDFFISTKFNELFKFTNPKRMKATKYEINPL